jgi:Fur family peroxide stress response transcriptional regulator
MRNTLQRQLTLDALISLGNHPNADEVFVRIAQTHPAISKATVYRNLAALAESGEILNIGIFEGARHYDHNCYKHHHFICRACGRIYDIDVNFSDVIDRANQSNEFNIDSYNLQFSGICSGCNS